MTDHVGVIMLRELDEMLGMTDFLAQGIDDPRDPAHCHYSLPELLHGPLYQWALGLTKLIEADALQADPALRLAVSEDRGQAVADEPKLPSPSTSSRTLAMLAEPDNSLRLQHGLVYTYGQSCRAAQRVPTRILDIDSLPVEVHGHPPRSTYNKHYRCRCYHPLVATCESGDILGVWLRPGHVHTSNGVHTALVEVVESYRRWVGPVDLIRVDAGFPSPELFETIEDLHLDLIARIKTNNRLKALAAEHALPALPRPTDAPRERWVEVEYAAKSWSQKYRVVIVQIDGVTEKQDRQFFLLTTLSKESVDAAALLALYRRRGGAEDGFGRWWQAIPTALSSSPRPKSHYRGQSIQKPCEPYDCFAINEVRLRLSALALSLLKAIDRLVHEANEPSQHPATIQQRFLWAVGRLTRHARRLLFHVSAMAAAELRWLWLAMETWRDRGG